MYVSGYEGISNYYWREGAIMDQGECGGGEGMLTDGVPLVAD